MTIIVVLFVDNIELEKESSEGENILTSNEDHGSIEKASHIRQV